MTGALLHTSGAGVRQLLFLGASVSQLDPIRHAGELGFTVVAVDADPDAVGFAEADEGVAADFSDVEQVVQIARRHNVSGIVAVSTDRAVPVAARVSEVLGLPGIGVETARLMTDKGAMRERLAERGLPQPPFAVIGPDDDPAEALAAVGTPAVLKPVDSGGQRGVFMIDGVSALRERLPEALAFSRSGRAILERFVAGNELNGIVITCNGEPRLVTLSDRLRPAGPGFGVGWAHVFPSTLPDELLKRVAVVAEQTVDALGLEEGIGFPQLLVASGEVFVVEVAARIPAGQMADLVRFGVGIDLVEIALRQAVGEEIAEEQRTPKFNQPLAVRFMTASPGPLPVGRIRSIGALDAVRSSPGVVKADVYMKVGETINPVQVDADRRGFVIATADDSSTALDLADRAAAMLELEADALRNRSPAAA
jgi:biotin carboxylase